MVIKEFWEYFDLIPMVVKLFQGGADDEDDPTSQISRMQRNAKAAGIKGPPSVL